MTCTATGSMSVPRVNHTATYLLNGRILVAGGYSGGGTTPELSYQSSAELYDPAVGTFRATGSMTSARAAATASLLDDGRVLIAGGWVKDAVGATIPLASAEIYDPASETFTVTGPMAGARYNPAARAMPDGRVYVFGGTGAGGALATVEVYDPERGVFTAGGAMATPRTGATVSVLDAHRMLVVGGVSATTPANPTYQASAELYDVTTGTSTSTGSMVQVRYGHTATALEDDRVLVTGGSKPGPSGQMISLASAELYDPATGTFATAQSMASPRAGHFAVELLDHRVLVGGGINVTASGESLLDSLEYFDPSTNSFSPAGSLTQARYGATVNRYPDGRILVAGGINSRMLGGVLASAEMCRPPV
jgi:N-acetylneuraminic acid mutarotase